MLHATITIYYLNALNHRLLIFHIYQATPLLYLDLIYHFPREYLKTSPSSSTLLPIPTSPLPPLHTYPSPPAFSYPTPPLPLLHVLPILPLSSPSYPTPLPSPSHPYLSLPLLHTLPLPSLSFPSLSLLTRFPLSILSISPPSVQFSSLLNLSHPVHVHVCFVPFLITHTCRAFINMACPVLSSFN